MRTSLVLLLVFQPPVAAQLPPSARTAAGGAPVVAEMPRATSLSRVADPAGFTATVQRNQVVLTWQAVPGVSWYLLRGPGLGLNGREVQGTSYRVNDLGSGTYEWTVATLAGAGKGPINNWTSWPRARVSVEASTAETGRYRISILGFRANRETVDDIAEHDGKHDEVYAAAYVRVMDRRSRGLLLEGVVQSDTYGEVSGSFPRRRRGGSAVPQGGICTGDLVPSGFDPAKPTGLPEGSTLPLLVWDGSLSEGGEVVLVTPTLWEWDGGNSLFSAWKDARHQETSRLLADDRVQEAIGTPGFAPAVVDPGSGTGTSSGSWPVVVAKGKDRPIGLHRVSHRQAPSIDLPNQVIAITREKIERELAGQHPDRTLVPGTIALEFDDDGEGNDLLGKYTLYLRVERTP